MLCYEAGAPAIRYVSKSLTCSMDICGSWRAGVCLDMGDRDLLSIGIGRLDEPARVRPTFHQCVSSKLPWLEISDNLPRFSENRITHPKNRQSPIVAPPEPIESPALRVIRVETTWGEPERARNLLLCRFTAPAGSGAMRFAYCDTTDQRLLWVKNGGSGLVRRPSGPPSIADILLCCREPRVRSNYRLMQRSIEVGVKAACLTDRHEAAKKGTKSAAPSALAGASCARPMFLSNSAPCV